MHAIPSVSRNLFPLLPGEVLPHRLSGALAVARNMVEDHCHGRVYAVMRERHMVQGQADRLCIAKSVALTSIVNENREVRSY
jgi:hypothetical protein